MIALGIDPGIANTGLAVVEQTIARYHLRRHDVYRTAASLESAERYALIATEVRHLLNEYCPDLVVIEDVYFGKNTSSAMTTAGVIAVCSVEAWLEDIPVLMVRPQAVKMATGMGVKATKEQVIDMAERMFRVVFRHQDNHAADACMAAIAGILEARAKHPHPK